MLNLAIIGFEHLHAYHYFHLLREMPGIQLHLVETDLSLLAPIETNLTKIPVYSNTEKLLSNIQVDGAIICTDNKGHHDSVIACARANIQMLCEKPIATTLEDAREMLALCGAHDVSLGICFPVRQSPVIQQARELIRQGGLGEVLAIKATNHGTMPGGWFVDPARSGGGAIIDHTVHVADALRWMLGAEFTRVFALASTRLHDIPVEDCGLLSLEMNNGVFVTLDTSWSRPHQSSPLWGDVSLRIVGTAGVLDLELFPWTINFFSEEAGKHLAVPCDGNLNQKMLNNFIQVIAGQEKITADGRDGLRALEVVCAAYKSLASGQAEFL
jgi:UDP-N-acetylglucosamine 3-dehydrogenase